MWDLNFDVIKIFTFHPFEQNLPRQRFLPVTSIEEHVNFDFDSTLSFLERVFPIGSLDFISSNFDYDDTKVSTQDIRAQDCVTFSVFIRVRQKNWNFNL